MAKVTDIGNRLEPFVDTALVESMDNVAFRLHQPREEAEPAQPLAKGDYGTVILDKGLYRAYYRNVMPGYTGSREDGHVGEITCYAESRDGIEWSFPEPGISEARSSQGGNVILAGQSPFSHNFAPFLDQRPGVAPDARYKALAGTHKSGVCAFKSGRRYTLRTDGFISARGGRVKGEFLTKTITFSGEELLVNFSASAAGNLRAQIEEPDGTLITGFSLDDCPVMVGDAIAQRVTWREHENVAAIKGKVARIRFELQECDLFSYRFR